MAEPLFPTAPEPPRGYLARSSSYRWMIVRVMISVAAYGLAYAAVVVVAIAGLLLLLSHPPLGAPPTFLGAWALLSLASLIAVLFLVKGVFLRPHRSREGWIELVPAREPALFAFLSTLAREVGAPMPDRVWAVPEVNAAVIFQSTLLSLVVPPKRELLLGLGLINALDVRELKALLAHELGHTSSAAMGWGNHAYSATATLRQLVHGHDAFDEWVRVARLKGGGVVLAVAAAIIRVLRSILGWLLRSVELGSLELMRTMELRADRVAIASAGSAATIRLLAKASYADACLLHAGRALAHATDRGLFTSDVFVHQLEAVDALPEEAMRPEWRALDAPLTEASRALFTEGDESRPSMWSTHPPSHERERAARAPWLSVREREADRSEAWSLFADPLALRQRMTMAMTRAAHPDRAVRFADPTEVSRFLAEERAAHAAADRDAGVYGDRAFGRFDVERTLAPASLLPPSEIEAAYADVYGSEHHRRAAEVKASLEALRSLAEIVRHAATEEQDTFVFRGFARPLSQAREVAEPLEATLERDAEWRQQWDARVARVHASMAATFTDGTLASLASRYAFHQQLEKILRELADVGGRLRRALILASGELPSGPLGAPPIDGRVIANEGCEVLASISELLLAARVTTSMPSLPNLPADPGGPGRLARILLSEPLLTEAIFVDVDDPRAPLERVGRQLAGIVDRAQRLRAKSLATLIDTQTSIAARWRDRAEARPAPTPT